MFTLRAASRRAFSTSIARRNLISEAYTREVRAFKAPKLSAKDAEGQVKPWSAPSAPKPPVVEGADAAELQAYAEAPVDVEGQTNSKSASPQANDEDWLAFEEEEGVAV
ncbi:ATP synthase complex subunit H-domain-containing protein [Yarrowia lipolytica]|uniref:ATP synthase subunit H, mitochondrial n=2 Tax=Yarrowia lipolytica TaxID=4952 RepID=ATP14_YARLI|nr:YALI0F04774p [Yarrowia lipolytica CLIB122]Q6C2V6.1 RecName: Full=ATP synthase subunit H, mitochondrial; Flags: Precursor [Yarrowia lipolytica CLIB122]AOW06673.1 hypothetical protein YALI1_F07384g [Yarrowia lipolytica]KAB8284781.1 ATP synthase complex subunit H-domain-containing protein [Yarrowia lipolytica]KAE8174801.1 ATP synthase complex subunit H-domain-containing protein [Yarrowia lipolytica]KAJ8056109.1 ATP synthase complex subunit H-domain-containing protein [Yarrowia lipolytica]QNQ0|eukprot:XP_505006.1 YALI0F04774p [Yarrowia lipolytica CLIB122]